MSGDEWSLDTLFDMVGIGELGGGYWYKIEAERVERTQQRPHGIKYSLTLHAPSGERLLGIDNAHGITEGGGPGKKRPVEWDHEHRNNSIRIYEYVGPADLLADFFAMVDRLLDERGMKP
jgi:hypothetical protein